MKSFKEIIEAKLSDGDDFRKIKALAAKNQELKDCIQEIKRVAHTARYKNYPDAASYSISMKRILTIIEKAPL